VTAADQTVEAIVGAADWNARVARIRQIPQRHGTDEHASLYAAIAKRIYVPNLAPDFAYMHWRLDYELADFLPAYDVAERETQGFMAVSSGNLQAVIFGQPGTLRVFRVLIGFTTQEFAASTELVAEEYEAPALSSGKVKSMEASVGASVDQARTAALTVHLIMTGQLFEEPTGTLRRSWRSPIRPAGGSASKPSLGTACHSACSCISATTAALSVRFSMRHPLREAT